MKHKTAKANVKTKTRLLSLLLAVLMMLFCFPVTALGTDEAEEPISETLEETADAGLSAFERGVGELSPEALESMTLNAADVPEVISAQAIAEKNHVLRLREQEENLNTVVFQNRDGGKTVYLYANPVKYVDANGNVKDKSTALKAENITLSGKTYSHSATENVFGQYYPTMPQNGVLITFGQYTVEMTPVITGILTLRDTAVANNKVTYNKVFGNGTSLVYTPTLSGVKEDIILQTYMGKSSFSFTLKTNGLAIVQTESDTFLADFEGNKVASLGKVIITDRANHTAYGSMTVAAKTEREEYTVTINAPVEFLTSSTTVYPVTVDPTLTIDEEFTPDGDYYSAIEDLCVYDGTQDPNYDNIATIGTYATNATSAMLYRITADAWDYLAVDDYLDSGRFHSATLRVPVMNLTTGLTVATTPSLGSWTDGDSQSVDSMYFEDYYPDANSNTTTLTSTANNSGASIDVTKVFEYFATHPSAVNLGFMMYVTPSTAISNPQSSFGVYQVEEADTDVYFTIDYDVLEGDYYINSKTTGQFLSILNATSVDQSIYNTSKEQAWKLTYLGNDNYTISRTLQPNRVLVMDDSGNVFIGSKTTYDVDNYTWHFTFYYETVTLYNVGGGKYLHADSNGNITSSTSSTDARWRLCETSAYVPLTHFTIDSSIELNLGGSKNLNITPSPSTAVFTDYSDYEVTNSLLMTISSKGTAIAGYEGQEAVTITHKPTGKTQTINVKVNEWLSSADVLLGNTYNVKSAIGLNNRSVSSGVTWSSSDPSVATVNSNGVVTGISSGYALVYAENSNSEIVLICEIKVLTNGNQILNSLTDNELQYLFWPTTLLSTATENDFSFKVDILNTYRPYYMNEDTNPLDRDEIHEIFTDNWDPNVSEELAVSIYQECYLGYTGSYVYVNITDVWRTYLNYVKEIISFCAFSMAEELYYTTIDVTSYDLDRLSSDLAVKWSNNDNSDTVLLGSSNYDGRSYFKEAREYGYSYFHSNDYDYYQDSFGDDFVRGSNIKYIQRKINSNKNFIFSHDPTKAPINTSLHMEYSYLLNHYTNKGYSVLLEPFMDGNREYWRLVTRGE